MARIAVVAGQSEHRFSTLAEGTYTVFARRQHVNLKAREVMAKAGADANCRGVRMRGKTMKDIKSMKPSTVALLALFTQMAKHKSEFGAFGRKCLYGGSVARVVHSVHDPAILAAAAQHRKLRSNPSLKLSPNGGPRGPGRRYAVHFRQPGPRVPPSVPA